MQARNASFYHKPQLSLYGGAGMYGKPGTGTPTEVGFQMRFNTYNTVQYTADQSYRVRKYTFHIFLGSKSADVPVDFSAFYEAYNYFGNQIEYVNDGRWSVILPAVIIFPPAVRYCRNLISK